VPELSDDSDNDAQEINRTRQTLDSGEGSTSANGTIHHSPLRVMETVDGTSTARSPTRPPPTRAWRLGIQRRPRFSDVVSTIVQARNEYEYSPIAENEIRLLLLQAGAADSMIECALVTSSDQEAVYEALSYAWGPNNPACEIRIHQFQGKQRSMKNFKRAKHFISENLHSALRHLRDRKRQVVLWVDALCINQDDYREKAVQVRKMANIYSRASNVCVWLGESNQDGEAAMKFIPEILDLSHFTNTVQDQATWLQWKALVDLMRRPWFSRLWMLQNIAVAREASVHCGDQVVHWADFADAVTLLNKAKNSVPTFWNHVYGFESLASRDLREMGASILVETANNLFRKSDDGSIMECTTGLETLVTTLSAFETADARDRIYALLSLAKPGPSLPDLITSEIRLPEVNYAKPVAEVFQEFVEFCVRSSYSLDIICRNWAPASKQNTAHGLPSWIPLLTGSAFGTMESGFAGRMNGDSLVGSPGQPIYHASGITRPVAKFGTGPNNYDGSLSVKGFRLDKISSLGSRNANGLILSESLRMGGWDVHANGYLPSLVPDKLWRTLVANRGHDGTRYPPSWYHRACLHYLAYASGTGDINTSDLIASGEPSILVEFLERVRSVIWNRKFLTTKREDLLGLAPSHAQEGDLICILFGCSVPVVLRERKQPQPLLPSSPSSVREASTDTAGRPSSASLSPFAGSENTYELIGECYIHGMMEGEAFGHDVAAIEARSETFKLI
jgi:hypothetical protein